MSWKHKVDKHCWKRGTERCASCRVATNLQNTLSMKCTKQIITKWDMPVLNIWSLYNMKSMAVYFPTLTIKSLIFFLLRNQAIYHLVTSFKHLRFMQYYAFHLPIFIGPGFCFLSFNAHLKHILVVVNFKIKNNASQPIPIKKK